MRPSIYAAHTPRRTPAVLLAAVLLVAHAHAHASAADVPHHVWSRAFAATPIDTFDSAVGIAAVLSTPAGGVVIVGEFHGSVDFGGGPIESSVSATFDEYLERIDVFGAAFDGSGRHLWSRLLARIRTHHVHRISAAIAPTGHIVLVGGFESADLGTMTLTRALADGFVAKLDPDGALMWGKNFGIAGTSVIEDVAIDADGDIVLTGSTSGSVDFGGGVIQSFGATDVVLAKLDPAGGHVWSRRFGGPGFQDGRFVSLDGNDRVSIAGRFYDAIDFGGGALVADSDEIFLATFDSDGDHAWSRMLNGTLGGLLLNDLASSDAGDVAIGAFFNGSIDLGGAILYGRDYIAARYDPTGAYRRVFRPARQFVANCGFDENRRLLVTGSFAGRLDLGEGTLESVGERDAYVARFDAEGALDGALQVSGFEEVGARAFATAPGNELWLTGYFTDGIDFGNVVHHGAATFLARFGWGPEPVLVISLFLRANAVEIRWSVTAEQPFETLSIIRYAGVQPETVLTGIFGSGDGSYVDTDVRAGESYQYELVVTTPRGLEYRSSLVAATVPAFANALAQNAPNPFVPTTSIGYSLSDRAAVALEIFDVTGARVRFLDQGTRDAGEYTVEWDGRDDAGRLVGSGVYFYRLNGVSSVAPRKMVLIR